MRAELQKSKDAAVAINVMGAIVGIIESGTPTHNWERTAMRIVELCRREISRQVKAMDAADKRLGMPYPKRTQM